MPTYQLIIIYYKNHCPIVWLFYSEVLLLVLEDSHNTRPVSLGDWLKWYPVQQWRLAG